MTADTPNEDIVRSAIELVAPSGSRPQIPENHRDSVRELLKSVLGQEQPTKAKWADIPYLLLRSAESTAIDLIAKGQPLAEHPNMPQDFRNAVIEHLREALDRLDAGVEKWAV